MEAEQNKASTVNTENSSEVKMNDETNNNSTPAQEENAEKKSEENNTTVTEASVKSPEVEEKKETGPKKHVVGMDFGTEKIVLTITPVGENKLPSVILNNLSNRLTPNVVSFREEKRLIGEEGLNCITRSPTATVHAVKRLIGLNSEQLKSELNLKFSSILASDESSPSSQPLLKIDAYNGQKLSLSTPFLTAMILKQIYATAKPQTSNIQSCVLGVPSSFSSQRRQTLLDAASIASIPNVSLVDESLAIALSYGYKHISKSVLEKNSAAKNSTSQVSAQPAVVSDPVAAEATPSAEAVAPTAAAPVEEQEKERFVLFVDIGQSYTQSILVAFTDKRLRVVQKSCDDNFGGRNLDGIIASHFMDEISVKHKVEKQSLIKNARTFARILQSSEKTKKVLSTNDETFFEVENIGEMDFKAKISRARFEDLISNTKFESQVKSLLLSTLGTFPAADLTAVEIVGGGTRVPVVQKWIAEALSISNGSAGLSRTMDSSSSVAVGCGLYAEILSNPDLQFQIIDDTKSDSNNDNVQKLSEEEIEAERNREAKMSETDAEVEKIQHIKNEIEKYLLDLRERFASNPSVITFLDQNRDIIYSSNTDNDFSSYQSLFSQLKLNLDNACGPEIRQTFESELLAREQELRDAEIERQKQLEAENSQSSKTERGTSTAGSKREKYMTKPQKIAAANKKKHQGNLVFKEFDYGGAAERYLEALGYLNDMYDMSGEEKKEVAEVEVGCRLNLAMCCMKLERWSQAVENCSKVLETEGNKENVKALFRRGMSFAAMKKYEEAKKDLVEAGRLEPKDANIRKELTRVNTLIKQEVDQQKKSIF